MILIKRTTILLLICCWVISHVHIVWCLREGKCQGVYNCINWLRGCLGNKCCNPEIKTENQQTVNQHTVNQHTVAPRSNILCWTYEEKNVAVYSRKGTHHPHEDRYTIEINVCNSGVSLLAVFDGHGSAYVAEEAVKNLMPTLKNHICEIKTYINTPDKSTFVQHTEINPQTYTEDGDRIDYVKLLTDEILRFDENLIKYLLGLDDERCDKISGSTALIAVIDKKKLFVANVGDSRGVMCNREGKAIKLSIDHKPSNPAERKRITKAGGNITFDGVYRVDNCLAVSRVLGDAEEKKKGHGIIADPEIKYFDLSIDRPQFLIMASDGLWDKFSSKEAVRFIRKRLNYRLFGAESIASKARRKGSVDDITVLIVNLSHHNWDDRNALIISELPNSQTTPLVPEEES